MSDINRINGIFRGLVVNNKDNNILNMAETGNYSLTTKNIENISYQKLTNISQEDSVYRAKKNITISSDEGEVIIRNGKTTDTTKYEFLNPSYSIEDDTFFDPDNSSEISKPFSSTEEVNDLRKEAFLLESMGNKSLCLYSNNGIHQVSHGNMNLVGDSNILLQASQKLNLTSMGYILLNSERLLASVEEDINILSSTGEFKVGGDGIRTIGIKVNSNTNKNYLSVGRLEEKADRNLHLDINEASFDNDKKNGMVIESKNIDNGNIFPDIKLINYDKSSTVNNNNVLAQLNLGLGSDTQDTNNSIFVELEFGDTSTTLKSLNNFKFTSTDVNKTITYVDTNFGTDTIKTFVSETEVILKKIYTETEVATFKFQQGYINRDNHGNLKTKTASDLHLGTNKNDILTIKNTGNIGINQVNPTSTLQIENNFGLSNNIRLDKSKIYQNGKGIQMNSGNYIIVYNTLQSNLYNLEASIYNINNDFVSNFTIIEGSKIFIEFDIDNLKGLEDKFVVVYCYDKNLKLYTETKIFDNQGIYTNLNFQNVHTNLTETSNPKVKSFQVISNTVTGEIYYGYVIMFREQSSDGNIDINFSYFSNLSIKVVSKTNITALTNKYLKTLTNWKSTESKNIKYISAEYELKTDINKIIFVPSGIFKIKLIDDSLVTYYITFISEIIISYDITSSKPILTVNTNLKFDDIKVKSDTETEILGVNLKLINNNHKYILTYYEKKNNQIITAQRESYNNKSRTLSAKTKMDDLTDSISTDNHRYNNQPHIVLADGSNYVIAYLNNDIIKYFQSENSSITILSDFTPVNYPRLLSIKDSKNEYLTTILLWNNENTNNKYYYQSINFKEILSVSSLINIKNENNNIQIKNNGNINIQDILSIDNTKNTTKIEKLVVGSTSSAPSSSDTGEFGEVRVSGDNLYIKVESAWKKIKLESI